MMRLFEILFLMLPASLIAQNAIGTGRASELYEKHCMICHGKDLRGGLGNSLLDRSTWKVVGESQSFLRYVLAGNEDASMPGFEGTLTPPEIRSLEIYIDEKRQLAESEELPAGQDILYSSGGYSFRLETVVDGLKAPWALAFHDDGRMLITEKGGALRCFSDGVLADPVRGVPEAWVSRQGGLLDVGIHPEYRDNGWVYLAYSSSSAKAGDAPVGMTRVVRGRIVGNAWVDQEVIFEVPKRFHTSSQFHFGTRLVFQDGYLFLSVGDRGPKDEAQDLSRPNGKIHRVHDDGRIPEDNPFAQTIDAFPSIWSYGNRNPQGLDLHPLTGVLWESEHGPRGGDEINVIEKGLNYGWPVITYGMNYNGSPITEKTEMEGMEQPRHYWTPSISVCGMDFYEGEVFPDWKYDLFVGGLASKQLHRLEIDDGRVVSDSIVLRGAGRVRDVVSGPDGYLYLVLNSPDKVVRLVPAK